MKATPTNQKLRGGYYTPAPIARFLADWAIRTPKDRILEPSCGDGNVLLAAAHAALSLGAGSRKNATVHGVELEPDEAAKARQRLSEEKIPGGLVQIHEGDFFAFCRDTLARGDQYDAVLGNPPFIRYQNWLDEHRLGAFQMMAEVGLRPTRLTNAWVPFVVASTRLLSPHGRLAMVIPAELLQVSYASELRQFLSDQYSKITLITFRKLVFEGTQQEIVLVLGERNGDEHTGIRTVELDDLSSLAAFEHPDFSDRELKRLDHGYEKWTRYFLSAYELDLLRTVEQHPGITRSGKIIDVDVGVVTGLNEFFVLNREQVVARLLEPYTTRIVSRSAHLGGLLFDETAWQANANANLPAYLLSLPDVPREQLAPEVLAYIEEGEERGINQGYKCRIRRNWWTVPSVWAPAGFLLRQIHGYPKLTVNEAGATSTDTIHRVRLLNGEKTPIIAAALINAVTFAFAEVVGRSYGGGVLELEPTEAERLPIPMRGAEKLDVAEIDRLVSSGRVEQALNITDHVLLMGGLGLTPMEAQLIRGIWLKLRDRRAQRR